MIAAALSFVGKYWKGILFASLLVAIGLLSVQNSSLRSDISEERQKYSKRESELLREVAARSEELRAAQAQHAQAQQKANEVFENEKQNQDKRFASLAADNERLRQQQRKYTGDRRAGETDSALIERYQNRLIAVGTLFEQCGVLLQEGFGIIQRRDREVKLLKETIQADRAACMK